MNTTPNISLAAIGEMPSVHLLLTEGDVELMAKDPDRVMEDIRMRTTEMGSVLEEILSQSHGEPRWGLNE
jgi:hypothetical protein